MINMMYVIDGTITHHTTNSECVSCDVPYTIPTFFVDAKDEQHAVEIARQIVCPFESEYEGVTLELRAYKLEGWK